MKSPQIVISLVVFTALGLAAYQLIEIPRASGHTQEEEASRS